MNIVTKKLFGLMLIGLLFSNVTFAGMNEDVVQLQKSWEKLKYQTPTAQQEKGKKKHKKSSIKNQKNLSN
jgi:hypothetical protein